MVASIRDIFSEIRSKEALQHDHDEDINDIEEAVLAFAEMIIEPPFTTDTVWWDIVLILSIFDYLKPEFEKQYGLNPTYPKPEEIREYIKNRRKKIIKDAKNNRNKRTGVKARVNKDEFKKLKEGQYITPLAAFCFFGDDLQQ